VGRKYRFSVLEKGNTNEYRTENISCQYLGIKLPSNCILYIKENKTIVFLRHFSCLERKITTIKHSVFWHFFSERNAHKQWRDSEKKMMWCARTIQKKMMRTNHAKKSGKLELYILTRNLATFVCTYYGVKYSPKTNYNFNSYTKNIWWLFTTLLNLLEMFFFLLYENKILILITTIRDTRYVCSKNYWEKKVVRGSLTGHGLLIGPVFLEVFFWRKNDQKCFIFSQRKHEQQCLIFHRDKTIKDLKK
jgi:hypothetical protein